MSRFLVIFAIFLAFSNICSAYPDYRLPERRIRGDVDSVFFSPFRIIGKRALLAGPHDYDLGDFISNPNV
ncbi:Neuropeptide-Like Protein [Caenorhabditis elegans]|uniref:Neuropeptide-Like Protein n=1 Tax=Caenorhabditis elegans TaxID=6239 RepID=D6VPA4_CAEEL|nr:Neuropeptide-Like Protein [Caenorhabditis elegans]CBM41191.1 Neuropeptide-Like Protein [Caenorhabditis elegans]|eukprot:NP_001254201.1 Neuropeptide-Like Protein [Caenorhabditis elegans]